MIIKKRPKYGGRDFGPGNNANPNGRPKIPEDIKKIRKLTSKEVTRMGHILMSTPNDLKDILSDEGATVLSHWIAKICVMGLKQGSPRELNELLNRLIGKVSERVEVTLPAPVIINRLNGDATVLGATRGDMKKYSRHSSVIKSDAIDPEKEDKEDKESDE